MMLYELVLKVFCIIAVCLHFSGSRGVLLHVNEIHPSENKKRYICDGCLSETFENIEDVEKHIEKHHSTEIKSTDLIKCEKCHQEFVCSRLVDAHCYLGKVSNNLSITTNFS